MTRNRNDRAARTVAAALLALAGCGEDDGATRATRPDSTSSERTATPATSDTTDSSTPADTTLPVITAPTVVTSKPPMTIDPPPSGSPGTPPASVEGVEGAIGDLASRVGADRSAISVVVDEEVTWRDGSLGCPEPGMLYTQALVPGRRVVLEHDGRQYAYHGGASGGLRFCARPAADGTAPPGVGTT